MTRFIIVDTDILIDASRGVEAAVNCLQQIENESVLAVSVVTQMELIIGCRNKAELRAVEQFLRRFQIFAINEHISGTAVELLKKYRLSHGLLIGDAMIAATAISVGQPLISKNQKDYRFIKGLDFLDYPYLTQE